MTEVFKPIAVAPRSANPLVFFIRLVFDLQLLTVYRFLQPRLKRLRGSVLDVGAGEAPWKELLSREASYTGIDIEQADSFGMRRREDIIYYSGDRFPVADSAFDTVLCIEVLEHVYDPEPLLKEIHRSLHDGGRLFLTTPWSARMHHTPFDFYRYSSYGLRKKLEDNGFVVESIEARGNHWCAIANKTLIANIAMARSRWLPLAIILGPLTGCLFIVAHLSTLFGGSADYDPLGWAVSARKHPSP